MKKFADFIIHMMHAKTELRNAELELMRCGIEDISPADCDAYYHYVDSIGRALSDINHKYVSLVSDNLHNNIDLFSIPETYHG